jgi:acyl-CoA thioester hydrolase
VFQTRLGHAKADDGAVFPWPAAARERAAALLTEAPAGLRPRSLDPGATIEPLSLARAEAMGLSLHGSGAFGPGECDVFGRVAPQAIMARISDGAVQSVAATRRDVGDIASGGGKVGMAVVEHRLTYFDIPHAGDRFDVRTGLVSADPKLLRFAHWMFDPASGRPWARADAALVVFDLQARKSLALPDSVLAALRARVVEGLD